MNQDKEEPTEDLEALILQYLPKKGKKGKKVKKSAATKTDYVLEPQETKHSKKRWGKEERKAVKRQLWDCMRDKENPKQKRSEACIRAERVLQMGGRTWTQVDGLVNNYIKGKLAKGYFSDLSDSE